MSNLPSEVETKINIAIEETAKLPGGTDLTHTVKAAVWALCAIAAAIADAGVRVADKLDKLATATGTAGNIERAKRQ
jgi:hypothetical protein